IGTSGLLYRFSTHLVYKSNVSPREAHLTETAGAAVTLPLVSRVVWKGARPETGTKAVIMELGRKFRGVDVPADQRAAVAVQMFELLERLHAKGIVHGDVKEGNFLWDRRDGKLRIVDFGSARFVEEDEGLWDGSFATEAYFAPGRMRGGKKKVAAPRVFDDYYALAVTLWGMYAERRPGRGQFNQKTIWRTDLAEVEDDMVREWIVKVLKMAGCRL
ncbi:kinase-like domain-containing protein, partial [Podospora aff. communis PSN243]